MSSESTGTTLEEAMARSLVLEELLGQEQAKEILKRTLSVGTVNSTTSSFAERTSKARFLPDDKHQVRDIGRGSCGSVFEIPGTTLAIKKGANTKAIWNDFNLTNHAYNSYLTWAGLLSDSFPGRRVPRVPGAQFFNGPDSTEFWQAVLKRFPKGDRNRAAAFHIDRILPVPQQTRMALVRQFYQDDVQTQHNVLRNQENKDCLIRIYLGSNNPSGQAYDDTATLRNFPLYLDQAKLIGIDINTYAEEMAIGLAILHWQAQIDAADTEFVIGSSTNTTFRTTYPNHEAHAPPTSTNDDFTQRETQMWMLDYDKCTKVDLNAKDPRPEVVNKYLVAVTGNDPYFPHPCLDVELWQKFRAAYLKSSKMIIRIKGLRAAVATFPGALIDQWEEWGKGDIEAAEFDPFARDGGGNDEDGGWGSDGLEGEITDSDSEEDEEEEEEEAEEEDDDHDHDEDGSEET
ncbi:hypothetical protein PV04_01120 [Phialophora macrospora]|uniref:DUF3669 domain-containing protein n=1 Tax=Phialophora macrospora TaxID=1851006 RepID=A0A0D2GKQ3_9EURO|nr:hypothetical protein PV04_01120 [Phialophora macrospora]